MHLAKSASFVSAVCSLDDVVWAGDDPHALSSAVASSAASTAGAVRLSGRGPALDAKNGTMPSIKPPSPENWVRAGEEFGEERRASSSLYSLGMTGRIGAKGQVVIPKALRDRAHLQPGDLVDFELRGEEIVLVAQSSRVALGGRFSKTGMAARLLEDRAREPR